MQNPFKANQDYVSKPKRNAFDCSKRVFFTGKFGALYPALTFEVNAGDSFRLDSEMLFQMFPFKFPVQTPITASVYVFKGRNRILWKSWMDFSYNNKQPSHPFILQPSGSTFWQTGSLADFLGVPTTYCSLGVSESSNLMKVGREVIPPRPELPYMKMGYYFFGNSFYIPTQAFNLDFNSLPFEVPVTGQVGFWFLGWDFLLTKDNFSDVVLNDLPDSWNSVLFGSDSASCARFFVVDVDTGRPVLVSSYPAYVDFLKVSFDQVAWTSDFIHNVNAKTYLMTLWLLNPSRRFRIFLALRSAQVEQLFPDQYSNPMEEIRSTQPAFTITVTSSQAENVDLSELAANPFAGTVNDPPKIPLNAIPFRLYEQIYNCFFRNEKNDPFILNGEPEYNKYITNDGDGADSTPYKIYFRNWDLDFLTSATQTPQQGIAPLVGINVRGDMEFMNEDGTVTRIRPTIASDGHTITGISGVVENGTPEAVRSAMEYISAGISINDFRQVNSLQRWLENNLRRGLKYRDQVLANTGVKIRYDELDMPEFLGGYSRPVQISSVTQSAPTIAGDDPNALGSRAGQAGLYGGSRHSITHYCDEAGFVQVIVCLHPQPVYTQLLPKYFLKSDALSYYHPQFGSIGMQPISYKEVCPIQVYQESGDLNATFGYQRPWYDLISSYDEAHGNMRTNMRDFLMHRTFAGIPQLGRDFLKIDPEQLNDVFSYTDGSEDVFQGQMYFKLFIKRAIPRFGIPHIE